jgi:hypothetical protein
VKRKGGFERSETKLYKGDFLVMIRI